MSTPRRNPITYSRPTYRQHRGVRIVKERGQPWEVRWNADPAHFRTLAGAKAYIDQRRGNTSCPHEARRRNPRREASPSHDLFGERSHKASLFGEREYAAVPKAKRSPKRKGKEPSRSQGRLPFGLGLFD